MEERKSYKLGMDWGKINFTFYVTDEKNQKQNIKNPALTELRKRYAHPETRPGGDDGGWALFVPSSGGLAGG